MADIRGCYPGREGREPGRGQEGRQAVPQWEGRGSPTQEGRAPPQAPVPMVTYFLLKFFSSLFYMA